MKQSLNLEVLTQTLIKSLRGSQTQESLSLDLNYNFNVANRWETGQRGFYWEDFLSLVNYKKVDLPKILKTVTHFEYSQKPEASEILHHLLQPTSKELLKNSFSSQKLNRLAGDRSKLLFTDFLLMIDCIYGRVERFLYLCLEGHDTTSLDALFAVKLNYNDLSTQNPLLSLLRMAIELETYKKLPVHSNELLAKLLNTTTDKIKEGFETLELHGVVTQVNGLYQSNIGFVDSGAQDRIHSRKTANYWRRHISNVAEDFENSGTPGLLTANLLYVSNPQLNEKIFEVCRKAYIDIKNLVSAHESEAKDSIRYINIDLFQVTDPPADS